MKYIAISNDSCVLINSDTDTADLVSRGFALFDEAEYAQYVINNSVQTPEQTLSELEGKSVKYINFGTDLWNEIKKKVWALNTYNKSLGINLTSEQMTTLFATSDMLEKSLKTGSLLTAIYICNGLIITVPQYSSIANFALAEINGFVVVA
jgi:hypothetical protein